MRDELQEWACGVLKGWLPGEASRGEFKGRIQGKASRGGFKGCYY